MISPAWPRARRGRSQPTRSRRRRHDPALLMKTTFEYPYFAVRISGGSDALIEVAGELDLASVPVFEGAVRELALSSRRRAVLDLGRLAFIDVAGLHAVLDLHAQCLDVSTDLTITPGPRAVQRVFELTGIDGLLPFRRRSGLAEG